MMKKTAATAALALAAVLGLSACSSELSTEDTCGELREIVAGFPDAEPTEENLKEIGQQFQDLSKESAEQLSGDIKTAGNVITRAMDADADEEVSESEEKALDRLDEACDLDSVNG